MISLQSFSYVAFMHFDHCIQIEISSRHCSSEENTAAIYSATKKNHFSKTKWPEGEDNIWTSLYKLDLSPQTHVNVWRWLRGALPLKERIYWSSSVDSLFGQWCPSSR